MSARRVRQEWAQRTSLDRMLWRIARAMLPHSGFALVALSLVACRGRAAVTVATDAAATAAIDAAILGDSAGLERTEAQRQLLACADLAAREEQRWREAIDAPCASDADCTCVLRSRVCPANVLVHRASYARVLPTIQATHQARRASGCVDLRMEEAQAAAASCREPETCEAQCIDGACRVHARCAQDRAALVALRRQASCTRDAECTCIGSAAGPVAVNAAALAPIRATLASMGDAGCAPEGSGVGCPARCERGACRCARSGCARAEAESPERFPEL